MNTKQWILVLVATATLVLSELFPPWLYKCDYLLYPAGYHFLTNPPDPEAICINSDPLPAPLPTVLKNSSRLLVQRMTVIVLTVGLWLLLRSRRTRLSVLIGFLATCAGGVGLLCFGLMVQLGI